MADSRSVVELAADAVLARVRTEIEKGAVAPILDDVRAFAEAEARKILADVSNRADEAVAAATQEAIAVATATVTQAVTAPTRKDAKDRALRTTVQGAIATVLVAVLVALADLIAGGGVDLFSSAGWKVVLGTATGAAIMAVSAYVQRVINPPKE